MRIINKISKAFSLAAIACITAIITASDIREAQPPNLVKNATPILEMAKIHTFEVAEAMPEDKYNYKPTE